NTAHVYHCAICGIGEGLLAHILYVIPLGHRGAVNVVLEHHRHPGWGTESRENHILSAGLSVSAGAHDAGRHSYAQCTKGTPLRLCLRQGSSHLPRHSSTDFLVHNKLPDRQTIDMAVEEPPVQC